MHNRRYLSVLAILLLLPGMAAAIPSLPSIPASIQFPHPQFPIISPASREDNNTTNQTDTTPPVLDISYPSDMYSTKTTVITVQGIASDESGIKEVFVSLNTADPVTAQGNTSWSIQLTLKEGRNTISVFATDYLDNRASRSISVVLETEKPGNNGVIIALAVLILIIVMIGVAVFRHKPVPLDNDGPEKENIEEPGEISQLDDFDKKKRLQKNKKKKRTENEEE